MSRRASGCSLTRRPSSRQVQMRARGTKAQGRTDVAISVRCSLQVAALGFCPPILFLDPYGILLSPHSVTGFSPAPRCIRVPAINLLNVPGSAPYLLIEYHAQDAVSVNLVPGCFRQTAAHYYVSSASRIFGRVRSAAQTRWVAQLIERRCEHEIVCRCCCCHWIACAVCLLITCPIHPIEEKRTSPLRDDRRSGGKARQLAPRPSGGRSLRAERN